LILRVLFGEEEFNAENVENAEKEEKRDADAA
jgi:hypothetical protein